MRPLSFFITIFVIFSKICYSFNNNNNILNNLNQFNIKQNQLSPLSRIGMDSVTINEVEGFASAFIGGTVGIMGTMMALEIKTKQDAGLDACPYCMGYGEILCATCLGTGVTNNGDTCTNCNGQKAVECINCKGDGRITPIILQNQNVRDPDSAYQALLTRTNTIENP